MALKDLFKRNTVSVPVEEDPVNPLAEQRRKEKFSTPLIYPDEFNENVESLEKAIRDVSVPAASTAPANAIPKPAKPVRPKSDPSYQMREIISPMYGRTEDPEDTKEKKAPQKKKTVAQKPIEDQLVPVISPIYGTSGPVTEEEEEEEEVKPTRRSRKQAKQPESTTDNLRNIANIIQEENDQLKIVEKRTGEFQFDFDGSKDDSLNDEIDDAMTLDELMSLYEKKFTDDK